MKWFNAYDGKQPFLASGVNEGFQRQAAIWSGAADCSPSVRVDFNRITLRTPCPGKAHYLKFAYHPTWRADTGDSLFLVSPGFLGIVPSRGEVELTFGHSAWWKLSALDLRSPHCSSFLRPDDAGSRGGCDSSTRLHEDDLPRARERRERRVEAPDQLGEGPFAVVDRA